MSRRSRKFHRKELTTDPVHSDSVISYFINKIMWDGKKEMARRILYKALEEIKSKYSNEDVVGVFKKAIDNCKPSLEVRSRRVGGATYQVPVDVRPVRRLTLAVRWLILNARARREKTMSGRLVGEILDAFNNKGNSIKKKEDMHRMAESNRAFSHYNW